MGLNSSIPDSQILSFVQTIDSLFERHNQDIDAHGGRIRWLEETFQGTPRPAVDIKLYWRDFINSAKLEFEDKVTHYDLTLTLYSNFLIKSKTPEGIQDIYFINSSSGYSDFKKSVEFLSTGNFTQNGYFTNFNTDLVYFEPRYLSLNSGSTFSDPELKGGIRIFRGSKPVSYILYDNKYKRWEITNSKLIGFYSGRDVFNTFILSGDSKEGGSYLNCDPVNQKHLDIRFLPARFSLPYNNSDTTVLTVDIADSYKTKGNAINWLNLFKLDEDGNVFIKGNFYINDYLFTNRFILKPKIIYPTNGGILDSPAPIVASNIEVIDSYLNIVDLVFDESQWEIYSDPGLTTLVASFTVTHNPPTYPANELHASDYGPHLTLGNTYYVRVRYVSSFHVSEWSDVVEFTVVSTIGDLPPTILSIDFYDSTGTTLLAQTACNSTVTPSDVLIRAGSDYVIKINGYDPNYDINNYTLTCTAGCANVTITQIGLNEFLISFNPSPNHYTVTFSYTVTDLAANSYTCTQDIQVKADCPVIVNHSWDTTPLYDVNTYTLSIDLEYYGTQPSYTVSVTTTTPGVTITPANITVTTFPAVTVNFTVTFPDFPSDTNVTFTVTADDGVCSDTYTFTENVLNFNFPASIDLVTNNFCSGNKLYDQGFYQLYVNVSDPENDDVQAQVTPSHASINVSPAGWVTQPSPATFTFNISPNFNFSPNTTLFANLVVDARDVVNGTIQNQNVNIRIYSNDPWLLIHSGNYIKINNGDFKIKAHDNDKCYCYVMGNARFSGDQFGLVTQHSLNNLTTTGAMQLYDTTANQIEFRGMEVVDNDIYIVGDYEDEGLIIKTSDQLTAAASTLKYMPTTADILFYDIHYIPQTDQLLVVGGSKNAGDGYALLFDRNLNLVSPDIVKFPDQFCFAAYSYDDGTTLWLYYLTIDIPDETIRIYRAPITTFPHATADRIRIVPGGATIGSYLDVISAKMKINSNGVYVLLTYTGGTGNGLTSMFKLSHDLTTIQAFIGLDTFTFDPDVTQRSFIGFDLLPTGNLVISGIDDNGIGFLGFNDQDLTSTSINSLFFFKGTSSPVTYTLSKGDLKYIYKHNKILWLMTGAQVSTINYSSDNHIMYTIMFNLNKWAAYQISGIQTTINSTTYNLGIPSGLLVPTVNFNDLLPSVGFSTATGVSLQTRNFGFVNVPDSIQNNYIVTLNGLFT